MGSKRKDKAKGQEFYLKQTAEYRWYVAMVVVVISGVGDWVRVWVWVADLSVSPTIWRALFVCE